MAEIPIAIITDEFSQDFEQVCETAVDLGIRHLEIRTAWNKNVVDMTDAEVSEIAQLAKASDLDIVSLASPVYKCTLPGGGDIDHRFQQDAFQAAHHFDDQPRILRRSLEIARVLGDPILRVFSFWRTVDPAPLTHRIVQLLREAVDTARPSGVRIGLENEHACNVATAAETAKILAAIDSPAFGIVWDPANAYVAGETPFPDGFNLLPAARILHVHAKDGVIKPGSDDIVWKELGTGDIDWKGQIAALADAGYNGVISLETHWGGPGGNKFEGSRICSRNLERLVAQAAS